MNTAEKIEIGLLIIMAISFFFIISAAGGADNDLMSLGQFIKYEIISTTTFLLSCIGVFFIERNF